MLSSELDLLTHLLFNFSCLSDISTVSCQLTKCGLLILLTTACWILLVLMEMFHDMATSEPSVLDILYYNHRYTLTSHSSSDHQRGSQRCHLHPLVYYYFIGYNNKYSVPFSCWLGHLVAFFFLNSDEFNIF